MSTMPVPAHLRAFRGEIARAAGGADEIFCCEVFCLGDGEASPRGPGAITIAVLRCKLPVVT